LERHVRRNHSSAEHFEMGITGQVVMITGAAGTLGKAVAAAFADAGAKLVLVDLHAAHLEAAFGAESDTKLPLVADLRDRKAIDSALAAAKKKFGPVQIVCNIAGGFNMGPAVHETTDEFWHHLMDLNAGSVFNVARAVVPDMLAAGFGKIVNIGAMGGVTGKGNMAAYSASKSVVARLTESLSAELREHGINVNCVLPSIIDSPANRADMPDADPNRWVAPAALADVILFLASDKARAIHGASVPVVGLS
jgi:NAD(P)-dependent dehydrogenase (short-subunit alcohol dehydrogenase family)